MTATLGRGRLYTRIATTPPDGADVSWRMKAACARKGMDPEWWAITDDSRMTDENRKALKIRRRQCDVLKPCRVDALACPPVSMVAGGLRFNRHRKVSTYGTGDKRPVVAATGAAS